MAAPEDVLASIRRLPLPERLRLIQQAAAEAAADTPIATDVATGPRPQRLTIDELLAARLTPPPGVGPVSLEDMDRAIARAASERGSL